MLKKLYPTYCLNKVEDITINFLLNERITCILLDLDNTLIDFDHRYSKSLKDWIKSMKKNNITLYILSNTTMTSKVEKMSKEFHIPYINKANKPFKFGFNKVFKILKDKKENIVMVGDQLLTDIYGGNRNGIRTILVDQITKKEHFFTKVKRPIERYIIKKYHKEKKA